MFVYALERTKHCLFVKSFLIAHGQENIGLIGLKFVRLNTCLDRILTVKHGLLTRKGGLSASLYALEGIKQMLPYERFSID